MLDVIKVQRPEEWQAFFQVPRLIYRHDPLWTPLPEESQRQMFDPQLNPLLRHVHLELFVALADDQPVGRIAAITDDLLPDKHIGFLVVLKRLMIRRWPGHCSRRQQGVWPAGEKG